MKKHSYSIFLLALIFAACQVTNITQTSLPISESPPSSLQTKTKEALIPTPDNMKTFTPTFFQEMTDTPEPTNTSQPSITPHSTIEPSINNNPGDLYETVFSILVGQGGLIQYRGGNIPDMEITGPNAIAVLPDDSFLIADLIANRLLHIAKTGVLLNIIALHDLGIVNVTDMRVSGNEIYLLEVSLEFSPPRYRVNRISLDGTLLAYYDIPNGFHIENGLTGIAIDCEGDINLEMNGGGYVYRLRNIQNKSKPADLTNGLFCNDKWYRVNNPGPQKSPNIIAGEIEYKTQFTTGFGSLSVLGVFQDGSLYIKREDVVSDKVIKVDQTVHFISGDLTTQGVARVPLSEYYYPIMRNVAINPRGEVYALLPRQNSLDIIHLNFYKNIAPLLTGAVVPQINVSTSESYPAPN